MFALIMIEYICNWKIINIEKNGKFCVTATLAIKKLFKICQIDKN